MNKKEMKKVAKKFGIEVLSKINIPGSIMKGYYAGCARIQREKEKEQIMIDMYQFMIDCYFSAVNGICRQGVTTSENIDTLTERNTMEEIISNVGNTISVSPTTNPVEIIEAFLSKIKDGFNIPSVREKEILDDAVEYFRSTREKRKQE